MPTIYAAGTPDANGYLRGISCSTTSELLGQIRDILTSAGCTVDSSAIAAATPTLRVTGTDGSDKCYTIWQVTTVLNNQKRLTIQGDLTGTGVSTNLSTAVGIAFFEGVGAKLYLSADQAGGVIFINNGENLSQSAHFGFLERTTNNPTYWMVGLLDVWLSGAQIATDHYGNKWHFMHRYYTTTSESRTSPTGAYQLLWDAMSVAVTGGTSNTYTTSGTVNNLGYKPWLGNIDSVTGKPNLGLYGYFVGAPATTSYFIPEAGTLNEKAYGMHFPGSVRFARTGLASLAPGRQFQTLSGQKFISGGTAGEFQGFAISA